MSWAKASSHAWCGRPASASTSSDEPTFTTMRRKSARAGTLADMFVLKRSGGTSAYPLPLWERVVPSKARNRVRGRRLRVALTPHPARTSFHSVLATLSHKGRGFATRCVRHVQGLYRHLRLEL